MSRKSPLIERRRGFTLIELLAVVLIICILMGIVIAISGYVNRTASVGRAKAQMAAMEAALETYKADWGYYPASTIVRFSASGSGEISNSWFLYRALTSKPYYTAHQSEISSTTLWLGGTNNMTFTYFIDPWGKPWNYYRPATPQPAKMVVDDIQGVGVPCTNFLSYTYGGQMNPSSYDLFSLGPDGSTYIPPGNNYTGGLQYYWPNGDINVYSHQLDDITNWQQQ